MRWMCAFVFLCAGYEHVCSCMCVYGEGAMGPAKEHLCVVEGRRAMPSVCVLLCHGCTRRLTALEEDKSSTAARVQAAEVDVQRRQDQASALQASLAAAQVKWRLCTPPPAPIVCAR